MKSGAELAVGHFEGEPAGRAVGATVRDAGPPRLGVAFVPVDRNAGDGGIGVGAGRQLRSGPVLAPGRSLPRGRGGPPRRPARVPHPVRGCPTATPGNVSRRTSAGTWSPSGRSASNATCTVIVGASWLAAGSLPVRQDHAVADQAGTVGSQQEQPHIRAGGNAPAHGPGLQVEAGNGHLFNNGRVIPLVPAGGVPAQDDGAHGPIVPAVRPLPPQAQAGAATCEDL